MLFTVRLSKITLELVAMFCGMLMVPSGATLILAPMTTLPSELTDAGTLGPIGPWMPCDPT